MWREAIWASGAPYLWGKGSGQGAGEGEEAARLLHEGVEKGRKRKETILRVCDRAGPSGAEAKEAPTSGG